MQQSSDIATEAADETTTVVDTNVTETLASDTNNDSNSNENINSTDRVTERVDRGTDNVEGLEDTTGLTGQAERSAGNGLLSTPHRILRAISGITGRSISYNSQGNEEREAIAAED